jgi:hypothetical protein
MSNASAPSTSSSTKLVAQVTVNGKTLSDAIRTFAGTLASAAVATGYPSKLAVINDTVKQGSLLTKRGDAQVSVGLAHSIVKVLPHLVTDTTLALQPGDTIELTVVSPADLAVDEFIPEVALTAAQLEAKLVADSIIARDEAAAKVAAGVALSQTNTAVVETEAQKADRLEAARLAQRAADGIIEADDSRPWVVTPAKWDAPRKTVVTFKVPSLTDVVAYYAR